MKNKIKKLATSEKLHVAYNQTSKSLNINLCNSTEEIQDDVRSISNFLMNSLEVKAHSSRERISFNIGERDLNKLFSMDKNITMSLLDGPSDSNRNLELANNNIPVSKINFSTNFSDEYIIPHKKEDYVVLQKNTVCPKCGNQFTALYPKCTNQHEGILKINPFDRDYYSIPVYYSIWVCPKCTYSNFYNEFDKLNSHELESLKEVNKGFTERFSYKEPRDKEQLLKAHYHAIDWALAYSSNNFRLGRLWLNMMCIYNFSENTTMVNFSSSQALKYFYNVLNYESSISNFTPLNQLYLVIAELLFTKNNLDSSYNYFINALNYTEKDHEKLHIKNRINNLFSKKFRV
ncbi:MAG: DUF2225 domain-containing protein [Firmicutes bacterium]|jgi:uncharacterized protein (DUF2225 family)|nr:DUF2225 domain-containing protein [Bacillota bacterium]